MAEKFKYLGRSDSSRDSGFFVLFLNPSKQAQKHLTCISQLLGREWASPCVGGRFYVAAIISVLLYGSESWVWPSRMLNTMCGFHHWACQRLAGARLGGTRFVLASTVQMMMPWKLAVCGISKMGTCPRLRWGETNLSAMQEEEKDPGHSYWNCVLVETGSIPLTRFHRRCVSCCPRVYLCKQALW